MKQQPISPKEEGQEIVLFGVLLAAIVVVGSLLAVNGIWLRAQWVALQESAVSAAAAGTLQVRTTPGARGLDRSPAMAVAERVLADNLSAMPFLDETPARIVQRAQIRVYQNPGSRPPYVTIRMNVPVRLPWGGLRLTLPIYVESEAGESPQ